VNARGGIYRSVAGADAVRRRHLELLDRWPVPARRRTVPTGSPMTSDDHALWLDDVLRGLELETVSLLGVSLGGWLALDYAIRRPRRVERPVRYRRRPVGACEDGAMPRPSGPVLVLWDIDQTLVSLPGLGRRLYEAALLSVAGVRLRELADLAGRTDLAILRQTLAAHGIVAADDQYSRYFRAIEEQAERLRSEMAGFGGALPGAADALAELAAAGTVQSVVTGNLRRVAAAKLTACGIGDGLEFDVGGYGDEGEDRALLVKLAMYRAGNAYREEFAGQRVVVIGDTPYDIRGARDAGVRSIGVASGRHGPDLLAAAGATVVLRDLTDRGALLAAVRAG
jgi:phosphoglycolate phosphatase-like HAD superfamily hydrolase